MKFIRLMRIDKEWSGAPQTNMISVNAESIRWMETRLKPEGFDAPNAASSITYIQLSCDGPKNEMWVKVLDTIEQIEALLA